MTGIEAAGGAPVCYFQIGFQRCCTTSMSVPVGETRGDARRVDSRAARSAGEWVSAHPAVGAGSGCCGILAGRRIVLRLTRYLGNARTASLRATILAAVPRPGAVKSSRSASGAPLRRGSSFMGAEYAARPEPLVEPQQSPAWKCGSSADTSGGRCARGTGVSEKACRAYRTWPIADGGPTAMPGTEGDASHAADWAGWCSTAQRWQAPAWRRKTTRPPRDGACTSPAFRVRENRTPILRAPWGSASASCPFVRSARYRHEWQASVTVRHCRRGWYIDGRRGGSRSRG